MRMLLAAAILSAGPAVAQVEQGDCARLAEVLVEGKLPAPWEDEADELAQIAEGGRAGACLAAFDLLRPSPPTGPADLPPSCIRLRSVLAEDGLPDGVEEQLDGYATAIGAGDAEGCAGGLSTLGVDD